MPGGVTLASIFAVLIPVGIVTVVLRWLPFRAFTKAKGSQRSTTVTIPTGISTAKMLARVTPAGMTPPSAESVRYRREGRGSAPRATQSRRTAPP